MTYEVADNSEFQIDDDISLLDLMIADMEASSALYQPTRYWKGYTSEVIELIRKGGLHDFRRSKERVLASFGCVDIAPKFQFEDIPDYISDDEKNTRRVLSSALQVANDFWERGINVGPGGLTLPDYFLMCERLADVKAGAVGLRPMSELSISRFGNPFGYNKDGLFRTFRSIYYFNFVCFVAQFADLSKYNAVVEIGSGSGAQAEILKKIFPQLTIVLLDLAPQLYVAERYLSKIFPDEVVPYRECHSKDWDGSILPGKIYCLPLRAIEVLAPKGKVMFWNAASFGEMEPLIVRNYAKYISSFSSHLFLMQYFSGKPGSISPVNMPIYESAFPSYELLGMALSTLANTITPILEDDGFYHNTLWGRKS